MRPEGLCQWKFPMPPPSGMERSALTNRVTACPTRDEYCIHFFPFCIHAPAIKIVKKGNWRFRDTFDVGHSCRTIAHSILAYCNAVNNKYGSTKTCLLYYIRNWNTELLTEPRPRRTTAEPFGVDVWKWEMNVRKSSKSCRLRIGGEHCLFHNAQLNKFEIVNRRQAKQRKCTTYFIQCYRVRHLTLPILKAG